MNKEKETLTHTQVITMSIVYDISLWSYTQDADFTLGNSLFGAFKLTKNASFNKYSYSGYGIGFDTHVIKN